MATDYTIPKDEYRTLIAENAKLRDELDQWHRLTAGIELPEYPITEFKPKDLERDNAKLRELCGDMMEFFEDGDWCVKCELAPDCQEQEQYEDECLMRFVFRDRMRELGVKVDG